MNIGNHNVSGTSANPYIIAETASAHQGDMNRAILITQAAAAAGTDCVKYQIWSRDECVTCDHPDYKVLGSYEFSRDQWLRVMDHAHSLRVTIAADVDDVAATELAITGGAELLKIRTTNLSHHELLQAVAESGRPIVIATGASTMDEITRAVGALENYGAQDVILMHGFQAFPTKAVDTHLRSLGLLTKQFNNLVGYADHADGGSPLAYLLPAAALTAGACIIEKHITIDREKKTEDYESSLNGPEFKVMIEQLRQVWSALGDAEHDLNDAEHAYRKRYKKSIVAKCHITNGQVITVDQISFKIGAELGFPADQLGSVIGNTAAQDITPDTVIQASMLQS
tara:strand:+ start:3816 stop:4838 length:1023 start_codon:yes stop_codon:yes gene_type:complete